MMERITAAQLLDELHIDPSDEETETVDRLIDDASAIIRGSISDEVEEDELLSLSGNVFNRLIQTLATKLYCDRELSDGYGAGIQIMLNQLRAKYQGVKHGDT